MMPIGQRISSPIIFSFLPKNDVKDDATDQQNAAEHRRTQQEMLIMVGQPGVSE